MKRIAINTDDAIDRMFGVNLELALKHKAAGDEVHLIVCRGALKACPPNSRHDKLACALCRSTLQSALRAPEMRGIHVHEMDLTPYQQDVTIPAIEDVEKLKSFTIDGINFGMEAASSVFTVLRDARPNLIEEQDLVKANLLTAVSLYRWYTKFFEDHPIDLLHVYNGRRSSQMPAIRAANNRGIQFTTFELAHDAFRYVQVDGTYFHDLEDKKREIQAIWQNEVPLEEKEATGSRFFNERRYGSAEKFVETRFAKRQTRGQLPDDFDPEKDNLIIYNSSEDEFAAVPGYENPVYVNQMDGIQKILNDQSLSPDVTIWIRVHPHLAGRNNSQTTVLDGLQHPQLRVIPSTAKVDSYELMEHANRVLTFGSTMGVESAFAGKPSILIGREPYEGLGCCYEPTSHREVMQLVNQKDLSALPKLGALKFGYWMIAREYDFRFFEPTNKKIGKRRIQPFAPLKKFTDFWWSKYGHAIRSIPDRIARATVGR